MVGREFACGKCNDVLEDCDACQEDFKKDEKVACLNDGWACIHHLHMDYCLESIIPEFEVKVIQRDKVD